ncbi:hypothetical protein AB1Y20_015346 [Prymnesium parvum]|uniref:Uncharacterized protein n=1 Tax=Prymnesium parvum TaxID=97485 RepID=A0AB34JZV4_PRYPA
MLSLCLGGLTALASPPPTAPGTPLLILGAGVLGRSAAVQWRAATDGPVIGVTRRQDDERDKAFAAQGITPKLRSELDTLMGAEPGKGPFSHVLFCASPSGNDDYVSELECATRLWDASSQDARFVFTSSAGVYAEQDGGIVTESSPVAKSPRTEKLLAAEAKVTAVGGTVVRLVGLYLMNRGAHNAWLSMEEVQQSADGLINLIHYDDAAGCAVAALLRGPRGETLLASDDQPLSRRDICAEALRAPDFAGRKIPEFIGEGGRGKVCDSSYTREVLQWEPRYKTFTSFISEVAAAVGTD